MAFVKVLSLSELPEGSHRQVKLKNRPIALFHYEGKITAIGNTCLHKGAPLAQGTVAKNADGECYVTCPWHGWQFNIVNGRAPAGYLDQQSVYDVQVEGDNILVSDEPRVKALKGVHAEDTLADLRELAYETTPTSLNVLGLSTTNTNDAIPRYSTSERALDLALGHAREQFGATTRLIRLRDLAYRHCEGYYSRHESACTWPCSISEMDANDGMNDVYRAMVLWADVVFLATPIRWGNASSLYYKMAERLNCVQNQITLHDRILIKNKVAAFLVTGGQDNIQQVVGQLNTFFTDLGFIFPPFNFVGWSRGWIAEDMENNTASFARSRYIKRSVKELVNNSMMLLGQVKGMDCSKMQTPKPRSKEAHRREDEEVAN